jgi:hypothetical protein
MKLNLSDMKIYSFLATLLITLISCCFISCGDNNVINPSENGQSDYTKILTSESGQFKIEVFSATASFFVSGYNDIGIKFYINNQPKTTGFVKFKPKMYHYFPGSPMHSSPSSPEFTYSSQNNMFMGYASMLMPTDTSMFWVGFFNYNNEASVDSVLFTVNSYSPSQVKMFVEPVGGWIYFITLVKPYNPAQGLNNLKCILHKTNNDIDYYEVNNAKMFIRPWMEAMGHGSSNNIHPVYTSGGIYEGTVNFNMSGEWSVYDSICVENTTITPPVLPKFIFDVP